MKNNLFIGAMMIISCLLVQNAQAQLTVTENGNVGIHTDTPLSYLSVGGSGISNAKVFVRGSGVEDVEQFGLVSYLTWGTATNRKYAIYGYSEASDGNMIGVKGEATSLGTSSTSATFGVYGLADGANSGRNYGVYGLLKAGTFNGTGIYGTNSTTVPTISARYAGYFYGNTYVNGTLYSTSGFQSSDARLKTNITDIKSDALIKIKELHPVQFQWQQVEDISIEDSKIIKTPHFSEDVDFNQKHYGFIAQDVQKLFPDLVKEDGSGYLSVNYVELIPLLVNAIQELSAEVEMLKAQQQR